MSLVNRDLEPSQFPFSVEVTDAETGAWLWGVTLQPPHTERATSVLIPDIQPGPVVVRTKDALGHKTQSTIELAERM